MHTSTRIALPSTFAIFNPSLELFACDSELFYGGLNIHATHNVLVGQGACLKCTVLSSATKTSMVVFCVKILLSNRLYRR
jgi:hypothetical protein